MLTPSHGNSHVLLGGRGKRLDLGQRRGRQVSRQEAKRQQEQALTLHGRNGELPAELGASPLAPSTRLLKGLMHVTKACNPVLPEFLSYEAACLMQGKQALQPCPWRSGSLPACTPCPSGHQCTVRLSHTAALTLLIALPLCPYTLLSSPCLTVLQPSRGCICHIQRSSLTVFTSSDATSSHSMSS